MNTLKWKGWFGRIKTQQCHLGLGQKPSWGSQHGLSPHWTLTERTVKVSHMAAPAMNMLFQFYPQKVLEFGHREILQSFQSKLTSLWHNKYGSFGAIVLLGKGGFQTFWIQNKIYIGLRHFGWIYFPFIQALKKIRASCRKLALSQSLSKFSASFWARNKFTFLFI